jgi:hypothetical protein
LHTGGRVASSATDPEIETMQNRESPWHRLLRSRISRRDALRGGAAAAGAALFPLELRVAEAAPAGGATPAAAPAASRTAPPFEPIRPTTADDLVLPRGFRYDVLRIYGDEVARGAPFGYNADFIGYFPIDGLEGGSSSSDGLLWVNHEYPNPLLMYGYRGGPKTPEQVRTERTSLGGSVFRVRRGADGRWAFVQDPRNRRVTGYTRCRLTGPAAGRRGCSGRRRCLGAWGTARAG